MLAESGYNGEKVVLINTHEIASIGALGDVTANNLRKLGMNIEIADSDWGTLVARRAKKDPPAQGGWNIFHTTSGGASVHSPVTNFTIDSGCGRSNWFGWPCDEPTEALRREYLLAPDDTARRAALVALSSTPVGGAADHPDRAIRHALRRAQQCARHPALDPDRILEHRQGLAPNRLTLRGPSRRGAGRSRRGASGFRGRGR